MYIQVAIELWSDIQQFYHILLTGVFHDYDAVLSSICFQATFQGHLISKVIRFQCHLNAFCLKDCED